MGDLHPNTKRLLQIFDELKELHLKKQADYGAEGDPFANLRSCIQWDTPPWIGCMIRLGDKVQRLRAFARRRSLVNESAADSLKDIAVYAVLALVLLEEEQRVISRD